jgi:hypothetical protein
MDYVIDNVIRFPACPLARTDHGSRTVPAAVWTVSSLNVAVRTQGRSRDHEGAKPVFETACMEIYKPLKPIH